MFKLLVATASLALCASSGVVNTGSAVDGSEPDRCTTIAVGKLAGVGGPMNTHTADCADCDFRINKVPARDWPSGTKRPLYVYRTAYPATVSTQRGDTWSPENLEGTREQKEAWGTSSTIEGYIPQVKHTYALYEAGYGIMNEHQVAIGESTCQARFYGVPVSAGGQAKIEVREMTHVALERSTTARQAIQIMGDLATSLGFYAADWSGGQLSMGEGGEGLTVVDTQEAWLFHVSGDDTGTSAVWVAQRIPDNHIAVIANQFVIRQITVGSDDFMYSSNIFDVAQRNGLWDPVDGPLDFLKVYAPERGHSPYATRRVWRVFNLAAPSVELTPFTDPFGDDYPVTMPVDAVLSPADLMRYQRDHYEGTQFDLSVGIAAGPFGWVDRYDGAPSADMNLTTLRSGGFERAISLFRTSYSFVSVPRAAVPDALALMWFTQYAPSSSCYTPLYVSASNPPKPYMRGSLFQFDAESSYWNFNAVGNYAAHMYQYVIADVKAEQAQTESSAQSDVDQFESKFIAELSKQQKGGWPSNKSVANDKSLVEKLTEFQDKHGNNVVQTWKNLLPKLMTKYHDGYTAMNLTSPRIVMKRNGYPKWWLEAVGYFNGQNAPNVGPNVIQFEPNPDSYIPVADHYYEVFKAAVGSGCVCLIAGMFLMKKYMSSGSRGYDRIIDQL